MYSFCCIEGGTEKINVGCMAQEKSTTINLIRKDAGDSYFADSEKELIAYGIESIMPSLFTFLNTWSTVFPRAFASI